MRIEVQTDATWEPVTLAEAKLFARVGDDLTVEDDLLEAFIASARAAAENECDLTIPEKTLVLYLPCFPGGDGAIRLYLPPIQSVTSITYYDVNGTLQTVDSDDYILCNFGGKNGAEIVPASTALWSINTYDRPDAVRVTYVAGWASASLVPEAIKSWIKVMVATMYDSRNAEHGGTMKLGYVDRLLDPYRMKEV